MADKGILLLLFVTFSLTCCRQASTTYMQLRQGDKLHFSDQLVSRNRDFALGFSGNYLVINSTYSDDHPVWSANRDKPIVENSGVLTLDDVGNLKITHSGGEIELYSGESSSTGNLTAVLEDNGNFVLKENSGHRVWESFDNPTDTLLPGMKLGFNYKRNKTWSLTSWAGEENPNPGEFSMEWDYRNGQIVVKRQGGIFWRSRKLNSDNPLANMLLPSPLNNFKFNIVSNDGEEESVSFQVYFDKLSPIQLRIFSRWFLKYNGDIFLAGRGWPDILTTSMSCDQNRTESECVNRELPNSKCRNDGSRIKLRTGTMDWLTSVHNLTYADNKNLSFTDCRDLCWKDCSCTGFQKRDQTICVLYQGSFDIKDLQFDTFDNPSDFGYRGRNTNQYYLIIPGASPPGSPRSMIWKWTVITLGIAMFTGIVSVFLLLRWKKMKQEEKFLRELLISDRPNDMDELQNDGNKGQNLQLYSIGSIKTATNSFSLQNKLGEGGFGPVYKGKLVGGQEIAVKRLSAKSGQGLIEFKNELIIIARLQHMNLVRLLGFCIQEQERLLIYEYLPNKSLDSFIFDQSNEELLDWSKRYNIIEGIAQGLTYLHKYSRLRIIHRDLKASNILLDKDMVPKISDFGMARIFRTTESATNTNRIVGTYGYMSPEYAMEGIFSEKSDVYSFGVLVLEIISGKRNHKTYHDERPLNLVGYTWEQWKGNRAEVIVDEKISYDEAPKDEVMRCINVALLCVEQEPVDRPSMPQVLRMLSNEEQLPMPKQPAFYIGESSSNQESRPDCSANGFSFTTMVAR